MAGGNGTASGNGSARDESWARLRADEEFWDILIMGGGATGLGCAVDAATRGYRTLLLDQSDFGKGTSSRSTKLIHGGVRYLEQGNIGLVREALRERGWLLRNAPHLVKPLAFVIPASSRWQGAYYWAGLKVYDVLAGRWNVRPCQYLGRKAVAEALPGLRREGIHGGVRYYDAQFDDARLAITLARTAAAHGATVLNYARVDQLMKSDGRICGVVVQDVESGESCEVRAKVVINATGVFTDQTRRLDERDTESMLMVSRGVHIVLDSRFLPGGNALMIPKTDDGRVLFAIPWRGAVLVGTTDTAVNQPSLEPRASQEEVDYLLEHVGRYLQQKPGREDIRSVFAGLRPLVRPSTTTASSRVSREHTIVVSSSGLLTITGGKWTTFREMAEDAVDQAAAHGGLAAKPCVTAELPLQGQSEACPDIGSGCAEAESELELELDPFFGYGTDAAPLAKLLAEDPDYWQTVHPDLPYTQGEVIWAVRHEMARTVDDVLARRSRSLILNSRAAIEAAPRVAAWMAEELHRDTLWIENQVAEFQQIAASYVVE